MGKSRTIKFKFSNSRASQVDAVHLIDALMGREPTPTCPKCGGVADGGNVPRDALCVCPKDDRAEAKETVK